MKSITRGDVEAMTQGLGLDDISQARPSTYNHLPEPSKAPLNLPEGSVRAIITLVIILAGCVATVVWKDVPGALGVAFGTVITSYFNARGVNPK